MSVKLIIASGKSAGRAIVIKRDRLLIGRADECDVRPLSEAVSRRHCAVHVEPGRAWVEDLKSRNGTFVNGERIDGKTDLSDGDMLRIGSLELRVSGLSAGEGSKGSGGKPADAGGEDDVSRWLMADDEPAGMFDTTHAMRAADDVTVPVQPDPAEVTVVKSLTPAPKSAPTMVPEASKKPSAENSRAAAADALKKFFGNR